MDALMYAKDASVFDQMLGDPPGRVLTTMLFERLLVLQNASDSVFVLFSANEATKYIHFFPVTRAPKPNRLYAPLTVYSLLCRHAVNPSSTLPQTSTSFLQILLGCIQQETTTPSRSWLN